MSINRRFLLKGMALGGLAGIAKGDSVPGLEASTGGPIADAATPPLLALVNAGAAGSVFLHGATAAKGSMLQVRTIGHDLSFMLEFDRQLRSGQPIRVIGLLDNASATLVVDLARGAGARIQWLGQHTAEAGYTRHHLLETDSAEGCARRLGKQLHACGAGFEITEERQGSAALPRQMRAPRRSSQHAAEWAAQIGYLLASLGTLRVLSAPAVSANTVLDGKFVSFSMQA